MSQKPRFRTPCDSQHVKDSENLQHSTSRKNLPEPCQLQLSNKQKVSSQFSAAYLKSTLNVKHFEKEDNPYRVCIFEIRDWEICFKLNVSKASFQNTLR